jgi:hypothetical protein
VILRPRPDVPAAPAAGRGAHCPALRPARAAGMLDEWRKLLAQSRGILLVQVDLILGAS